MASNEEFQAGRRKAPCFLSNIPSCFCGLRPETSNYFCKDTQPTGPLLLTQDLDYQPPGWAGRTSFQVVSPCISGCKSGRIREVRGSCTVVTGNQTSWGPVGRDPCPELDISRKISMGLEEKANPGWVEKISGQWREKHVRYSELEGCNK